MNDGKNITDAELSAALMNDPFAQAAAEGVECRNGRQTVTRAALRKLNPLSAPTMHHAQPTKNGLWF